MAKDTNSSVTTKRDGEDTNSRYERNNGRIEPHYMCGTETKQEVHYTSVLHLNSRMTALHPEIGWNTENTEDEV